MKDTAPSKRDRKTRTLTAAASVATPDVSPDAIARRAYEYYCARGGQPGDPLEDWLRAERELLAEVGNPVPVRRTRRTKTIN